MHFLLTRSGLPSLEFDGMLVATVDGKDYPPLFGDQQPRQGWVALYATVPSTVPHGTVPPPENTEESAVSTVHPRTVAAPSTVPGGTVLPRRRWHVLRLFQTRAGQWVASITYRTTWPGEVWQHHAYTRLTLQALARDLEEHNPTANVAGYPPEPQYDRRNDRLRQALRWRYRELVSDLLAKVQHTEVVA